MICTTHQNIIRMIKSKRMRWMAHVAGVRDSGGAYRVLVRRPDSTWKIYMDGPKSNENDFLRRAVGPGKDSGGRGRWRRNPGIHFDLTQVSPRLCSIGTLTKCVVVFVSCHGRKCRGVWSSVTRSSSARNSERLVPKRCSC